MGLLTGTYLVSKAQELLVDAEGVTYTDQDIIEWINEGQRAVCQIRPDANTRTENLEIVSGVVQTLPETTRRLMRLLTNVDTQGQVGSAIYGPVPMRLWDRFDRAWRTEEGSEILEYAYNPANPKTFHVRPALTPAVSLAASTALTSNGSLSSTVYNGFGQSFQGNGDVLSSVRFYLERENSPVGNAVAYIYAHSGTYGTDSVPTGDPLATSATVDVSTIPTIMTPIEFTFSSNLTVEAGVPYVVVLEYFNSGGGNIRVNLNSGVFPGNASTRITPPFAAQMYDWIFELYTKEAIPGYVLAEIMKNPTDLTVLTDTIDINDVYSTALIHFVTAMLCLRSDERTPTHQRGQYHMNQFYALIGAKTQGDTAVTPAEIEQNA